MNSRLLAAFGLGALTASISLGAIQFASAAGDSTITACASKTTGSMRYIAKGSCKKTELRVSWNQQGPQGLPGTKGDTGSKGDSGANGSNGTNGQNIHVVDAAGKDLGVALGVSFGGQNVDIVFDGGIWTLTNTTDAQSQVRGALDMSTYFSDSACNEPLAYANLNSSGTSSPAFRGVYHPTNSTSVAFKLTGSPFLGSTLPVAYARYGPVVSGVRSCVASTNPTYTSYFEEFSTSYFSLYTTVTAPSFTGPLSYVQK